MRVPYMDMHAEYMDTPHRRVIYLRPDGLDEIPMLGRYSYTHARPDLPVHRHFGGIEFCYRERGNQVFEVGGQQYHLHGGDVFVAFPDEPHSTGGNPSEPGILFWLNVRLPRPNRRLLGLPADESAALVERLLRLPHRHFHATGATKALFGELFRLHDRPETPLRNTRLRNAAIQLLLEVIDGAARCVEPRTSQRMTEIIRLIRDNALEDLRLEDLARRAHLSVSHFKKRFKAETGLAPWQFILQAKIEAAKELLRTTRTPVGKVAMDLGFVSSQYFATVFKRITGVTPTGHRRGTVARTPSTRRHDGQG